MTIVFLGDIVSKPLGDFVDMWDLTVFCGFREQPLFELHAPEVDLLCQIAFLRPEVGEADLATAHRVDASERFDKLHADGPIARESFLDLGIDRAEL